jgi:hypothetical protein
MIAVGTQMTRSPIAVAYGRVFGKFPSFWNNSRIR